MLPFYDRRPERVILRRPVAFVAAILVVISMGVLTWKGATAKEAVGGCRRGSELGQGAGIRRQPRCRRGRHALRRVGLPQLPRLPRCGWSEPGRARVDRGRTEGSRHRVAGRASQEPEQQVPGFPDARIRRPRRGEPAQDRDIPRSVQGAAEVTTTGLYGRRKASPVCEASRLRLRVRRSDARLEPDVYALL